MEIGWLPIGKEGGHIAGRNLLHKMYTEKFGTPAPEILVTERGKPYFAGNPVFFSISHTKKHAFCVLSERPVGIDAEEADRNIRPELAEKILSAGEMARYRQATDKHQTLLRFWVLKEAFYKCTGDGLQGYPNKTDFSPDDPRIREIDGCLVAIIEAEK